MAIAKLGRVLAAGSVCLLMAGCWPGEIATDGGEEQGDGETETETGNETGETSGDGDETGIMDLGSDERPGWCCECESMAGGQPIACTPSSSDECNVTGWEWCELDDNGHPSDCESACAPPPPPTTEACCYCSGGSSECMPWSDGLDACFQWVADHGYSTPVWFPECLVIDDQPFCTMTCDP